MNYDQLSLVLKAMADPNRMKIIDLLSTEQLCACDVLAHFDFTQPTLSHHMKVLEKAGIVSVTKEKQWHNYALRPAFIRDFSESTALLLSNSEHGYLCQADTCDCHVSQGTTDQKNSLIKEKLTK